MIMKPIRIAKPKKKYHITTDGVTYMLYSTELQYAEAIVNGVSGATGVSILFERIIFSISPLYDDLEVIQEIKDKLDEH